MYAANEAHLDLKMRFLSNYVEKNFEPKSKKKFMITKNKLSKTENNDLDLLNNDSIKRDTKKNNIFEFKPGHRWGGTHEIQATEGDDENQTLKKE